MVLLTKQNLRKLYACFVRLPPFCNYRMPAPHKVTFKVVNDPDTYGWFVNDPPRIEISKLCEDFNKVNETLLHEMIHCMLWYNKHKDFDQHDHKFDKYAEIVCNLYGYDKKEF
mgnify:CR=1 FL=1